MFATSMITSDADDITEFLDESIKSKISLIGNMILNKKRGKDCLYKAIYSRVAKRLSSSTPDCVSRMLPMMPLSK